MFLNVPKQGRWLFYGVRPFWWISLPSHDLTTQVLRTQSVQQASPILMGIRLLTQLNFDAAISPADCLRLQATSDCGLLPQLRYSCY